MAEFKQWRNDNRVYLKDVIPLKTPYNLKVEVSSLCNARCVYCAHASNNHGVYEGNMTLELFERILDDSKRFKEKYKVMEMFSFGEPLCNPDLAKMIKKAKEADVADSISFTTNGLLLTKEKSEELVQAGTDTIRISLQGLDAKTYWDVCKVKMDFDVFVDNLTYLYSHKGNCTIRMKIADIAIMNDKNGKEKLERIFGKIADSVFVENIIPMYAGVDYDSLGKEIHNNSIHGREGVFQSEYHIVCHRPFYRLRVSANGMVTAACCDVPNDIYYGNIYEKHLDEIWESGVHNSFLRMQLEGKRFSHPVCRNCVMPNDITTEADILDPYAEELLKKF